MRRVAMLLGTVGVIALALAATPAQAQNGWWGYPNRHEQAWREHQWREHHYRHPWYNHYGYSAPHAYYAPGVTLGFNFR